MRFTLSRKHLCIPYAMFLLLFVIFPVVIIALYAFTDKNWNFTLGNFSALVADGNVIVALFESVKTALLTTLFCFLIGYPIAYILSNSKYNKSKIMVMLFILPMWVNFLLRTLAIREILTGVLGMKLGQTTVVIGMVYDFLPFMILPIYNTLLKMDKSLIEAGQDLGANPMQVFFRIVIPASFPGIVSGIIMVFMPCMTTFAISDLLSDRTYTLIGNIINLDFGTGDAWNQGAAISFFLLLIVGVTMLIQSRFDKDSSGGRLW